MPKTDFWLEPTATQLEERRQGMWNAGGRLTYDCLNAILQPPDRVRCDKGHVLGTSRDGTAFLMAVLRGTRLGPCQLCPGWEDMEKG